jgi:hypothetical protein
MMNNNENSISGEIRQEKKIAYFCFFEGLRLVLYLPAV